MRPIIRLKPRLPRASQDDSAQSPSTNAESDRNEALGRFDTGGLDLLEDVADAHGFDPYGHGTLRAQKKPRAPRTDLRALSAQILAERARKTQT